MLNGVLVVRKPLGLRSTDCLRHLSRVLGRQQKIGHAGTLDSTASGALIVMLGRATRLSNFVMDLPKRYVASVQFGWETDTDDREGRSLGPETVPFLDDEKLSCALLSLLGTRLQVPPAVSAVKVAGERSHRLARGGYQVENAPRPVTVTSIRVIGSLEKSCRVLDVRCHRGTYVRSLARDLGRVTGWKAHLNGLERVSVGNFCAEGGLPPDEFSPQTVQRALHPVTAVARHYARVCVSQDVERRLLCGLPQRLDFLPKIKFGPVTGPVAVIGPSWLSLCRNERRDGMPMLSPLANVPLAKVVE